MRWIWSQAIRQRTKLPILPQKDELRRFDDIFGDFEGDENTRQIYTIWNIAKATNQVKHFGNIPPEIIDNLLYLYTKPFDVVFDPFGGGGSSLDVCRKRFRQMLYF